MNPLIISNKVSQSAPLISPPISPRGAVIIQGQLPAGSIIHLKALETMYDNEVKLVRSEHEYSMVEGMQLSELNRRSPYCRTLNFRRRGIHDVRPLLPQVRNEVSIFKNDKQGHVRRLDTESGEIYLNTFVIRYYSQLRALITLIKEIDIVGCTLEGESVGRTGSVSWIILAAKNTLIPLDIVCLSTQVPNLWNILKTRIFQNGDIVKVFHDCRPSADYLYHRHGIQLNNVFDIQVADANIEKNTTGNLPTSFKLLSTCLALYRTGIPLVEIQYLQKYESKNFSGCSPSPWMLRPMPPPDILKFGALKVKHLVVLKEILTKRLLNKFQTCVQAHIDVVYSEASSYFLENPSEMSNLVEAILLTEVDPHSNGTELCTLKL